MRVHRPAAAVALWLLAASLSFAQEQDSARSEAPNGFSLEGLTAPRGEIVRGGPPRDGIHSVDEPGFAAASDASWIADDTVVIGVALGGEARAYPLHLLDYHQIVNDTIAGVAIAVTWDPLSGSPVVYERKVAGRTLDFGVSGLVYRSNFLLYDRQTESLWSQWLGRALAGPLAGSELKRVERRVEAFGVWLARHPGTRVLERPELRRIDYRHSPFSAYWVSDRIPFPVPKRDDRFHPKQDVLGVEVDGKARVYVGAELEAAGGRIVDELAGHKIRVAFDAALSSFQWQVPPEAVVTPAYWFSWIAFHPDTEVWSPIGASP